MEIWRESAATRPREHSWPVNRSAAERSYGRRSAGIDVSSRMRFTAATPRTREGEEGWFRVRGMPGPDPATMSEGAAAGRWRPVAGSSVSCVRYRTSVRAFSAQKVGHYGQRGYNLVWSEPQQG